MLGVVRAVVIILAVVFSEFMRFGVQCGVVIMLGVVKIWDVEVNCFDFMGMMYGIVGVLNLFSGTVRGAVVCEVLSDVEAGCVVSIYKHLMIT